LASIDSHRDEYKAQEKWLEFGFPEEILTERPECVDFLMKSGAARLIAMFKNSTSKGIDRHEFQRGENGAPLIRMNKKLVSWDKIKELLTYDSKRLKIVSKSDPKEVWTYVSPDGFIQQDPLYYDKIFPVEKVSQEEYSTL